MKKQLKFRWAILGALIGAALPFAPGLSAATAFVYDTGSEMLTSADFNHDGLADILVLDKATGNIRLGLLDGGGNVTWTAPLVSGVDQASALAVGEFLAFGENAVAVTGPTFNRIDLVSLAHPNGATNNYLQPLFGVGPNLLVTLDNPFGLPPTSRTNLLIGTSQNAGNFEAFERDQVFYGYSITPFSPAQFSETNLVERGNSLALNSADSPSFACGLARGALADRFDIFQFTNDPGGILVSLTNLPPGGDYAAGNFNGETLPRFAFYQSGASNALFASLAAAAGGLVFPTNGTLTFGEAVQNVFYLPSTGGAFLVEFADGVQAVTFSGGAPIPGAVYRAGLGGPNHGFTGIVPLASGQFALLDAAAGAQSSTHAQVIRFDGANFAQISTSSLPGLSSGATRANVWLFNSEPFVNRDPGFVESLASPDWSDLIAGLPGQVAVAKESDAGSGTGLGNFRTNAPTATPPGANFGLANQVAAGISIFGYAPPRLEPATIAIAPPPGSYSAPIQITFTSLGAGGPVYYRADAAANWSQYLAPFNLANDATVEYYGVNLSGAHSRIFSAAYTIANSVTPATVFSATNGLPQTNSLAAPGGGEPVVLSTGGTVFYGRRNATGGAVWAINLDGSGDTYVTTGARPRISRDGRYLAFMRGANVFGLAGGDLWLRDLTSGDEWLAFANSQQIVGYDFDAASPPNLIFDYACNFWQVSVTNPAVVVLWSNNCTSFAPVVNPVSGGFAFFDAGSGGGIATVVGGVPTPLSSTTPNSRWPAWSPDGSRLSFCLLNNPYAANGQADLFTIGADGSGLAQISAFSNVGDGFLHGAVWTPAGNALVGAGSIYGTNGLWMIPLTSDARQCDCPAKLLPTTAGDSVDFAGGVVAAPAALVVSTGLLIRADTNAVVVYWSTNNPGFSLQATLTLGDTNSWSAVTGPYYLNGGFYEYHEPLAALAQDKYFRLHYPGTLILQPAQP